MGSRARHSLYHSLQQAQERLGARASLHTSPAQEAAIQTLIDITGERYGRLLVLRLDSIQSQKSYWLCLCDCGKEKVIRSNSLRTGRTTSCGCYRVENATATLTEKFGISCPKISWRGKEQSIADWARELHLTPQGLANRLKKWPLEKALTEPKQCR